MNGRQYTSGQAGLSAGGNPAYGQTPSLRHAVCDYLHWFHCAGCRCLPQDDLGWGPEQVTFLLQCAIFTGGIATFVQAKGLGPVGAWLPILLGTTFVVITPLVAITTEYGYDAFLGAVIAGGVVYVLLAWFGFRFLRKLFSSTVSGTLVISIAATLAPPARI